jgi:hypothetical protein
MECRRARRPTIAARAHAPARALAVLHREINCGDARSWEKPRRGGFDALCVRMYNLSQGVGQ